MPRTATLAPDIVLDTCRSLLAASLDATDALADLALSAEFRSPLPAGYRDMAAALEGTIREAARYANLSAQTIGYTGETSRQAFASVREDLERLADGARDDLARVRSVR